MTSGLEIMSCMTTSFITVIALWHALMHEKWSRTSQTNEKYLFNMSKNCFLASLIITSTLPCKISYVNALVCPQPTTFSK